MVLVDEDGHAVGVADKAVVHDPDTPLHLAFSCYVFDAGGATAAHPAGPAQADLAGRVDQLVLRAPGARRADRRGGAPADPGGAGYAPGRRTLVLPGFRYRAQMPDGTTENELCPVFVATTSDEVRSDPAEVAAHRWVPWAEFRPAVVEGSLEVSPWCVEQLLALPADPWTDPPVPGDLPPAALPG